MSDYQHVLDKVLEAANYGMTGRGRCPRARS